jgi:hypothetical protein
MKHLIPFSRKRRQWLRAWTSAHEAVGAERQRWMRKLRRLAHALRPQFTVPQWARVAAALVALAAAPEAAEAQVFTTPNNNGFGLSTISANTLVLPSFVDMDNDGDLDLMATDLYGSGVYFVPNTGSASVPVFGFPQPQPFGLTDTNMFYCGYTDLDNDGDIDVLGYRFDYYGASSGFYYFQNTGTRTKPKYALGVRLKADTGKYLTMDLEMITPTAIDWDKDGDLDLICGDEDGRVAFIEHTGKFDAKAPVYAEPRYFQQEADQVKFGALVTPVGFDWDGDGDTDLICGNTAGYVAFIENLSGKGVEQPKWAAPVKLTAAGKVIRPMAGPNGSIQGPCEAKWGYTTQTVADWDQDGLPDLLLNSILGKVVWFKNIGTRQKPQLAAAQPIEVEWNGEQPHLAYGWLRPEGKALLTQWRTTPVGVDWNKDGLTDLVILDQEGYLAFFERAKQGDQLVLKHPQRVICASKDAVKPGLLDKALEHLKVKTPVAMTPGEPLRLNAGIAGKSGRRKLCIMDWDQDGKLDILLNSANANFLRQESASDGKWFFTDMGLLSDANIEGHDVSPTTVDFNADGVPDFVGGAEDGHLYYMRNPKAK